MFFRFSFEMAFVRRTDGGDAGFLQRLFARKHADSTSETKSQPEQKVFLGFGSCVFIYHGVVSFLFADFPNRKSKYNIPYFAAKSMRYAQSKKSSAARSSGAVLALTYLPGPSPDKYFRHW